MAWPPCLATRRDDLPLTLQAHDSGWPTLLLLLHVRPRADAAGLEIAVHSGVTDADAGNVARMHRHGALFAVASTTAGLEAFAADVLATSPEVPDPECGTAPYVSYRMMLPTYRLSDDRTPVPWDSVHLDLLAPDQLYIEAPWDDESWVSVSMPFDDYDSGDIPFNSHIARSPAFVMVDNPSAGGAAAPTPGQAEHPDGDAVSELTWRPMRDRAMADLQAALASMLRQAVCYRGRIELS